jgi:hypothetical protein
MNITQFKLYLESKTSFPFYVLDDYSNYFEFIKNNKIDVLNNFGFISLSKINNNNNKLNYVYAASFFFIKTNNYEDDIVKIQNFIESFDKIIKNELTTATYEIYLINDLNYYVLIYYIPVRGDIYV